MEKLRVAEQAYALIEKGAPTEKERLEILCLVAKMMDPGLNIIFDKDLSKLYSGMAA